jgi:hypothetical protein
MSTTNTPPLTAIPAGTRPARCSGCGATIYWIVTERGARAPLSVGVTGGKAPTDAEPGLGASHFVDCPAASRFHKRSR